MTRGEAVDRPGHRPAHRDAPPGRSTPTPANATHWSTRSMASAVGLNQTAVTRIWRAFGLQPHRQESWKLSKDPQFVDKVKDVVGLYLNPPERAVVLCVDEKSQIQALDRTAPIFPMMPGVPARATHDYKRAGTSSLYAALDLTTGKVIGALHSRHRAVEFKKFLVTIDREVPAELEVHVVLDNASTHKTPAVKPSRSLRSPAADRRPDRRLPRCRRRAGRDRWGLPAQNQPRSRGSSGRDVRSATRRRRGTRPA